MNVVYRLANCDDLDSIYEIEKASFLTPWTYESLKHDLCINANSLYITALMDNMIVGFCGVHIVLDECHINNLAVLRKYRRQGIGRGIINTLLSSTEQLTKLYWLEDLGVGLKDPDNAGFEVPRPEKV